MDLGLAENIRAFRKARSLTQAQLAEALGVTVGAVYKWEAKLSIPDISLVLEMADFFDVSVDVLLGYKLRDNRQAVTASRLRDMLRENDAEGMQEAEKALQKYPNCFDVVYYSAKLYQASGISRHDAELLARAVALFEHALLLLAQNTDPEIDETSLYRNMAEAYICMDRDAAAVEILKKHNPCGINNASIGLVLSSSCDHPSGAVPYLSEALIDTVTCLTRIVMGYFNVYLKLGNYTEAEAILQWGLSLQPGLKRAGKNNILEKAGAAFHVCLAMAQIRSGDAKAAAASLRKGREMARRFDGAPDYDADSVRFVTMEKQAGFHDDLGATAMLGMQKTVDSIGDETLTKLWKEIAGNEKQ